MSRFGLILGLVAVVALASLTSLVQWTDGRSDHAVLCQQLLESALIAESTLIAVRLTIWLSIFGTLVYMHSDKIGRPILVHNVDLSTREIRLVGLQRFCTFTVWSWCLQFLFFTLTLALHFELVPRSHLFVRAAVVLFEVSLAVALLVTSVVTFVLIPSVARIQNDLSGFFTLPALMMHNANVFFMVAEIVFNQVEVKLAHLPFALLYGVCYIVFSWTVASRLGYFFYFFINYNFKHAFVSHLLLIATLGSFFALATLVSHYFNPEQNALSIPILILGSMLICTVRAPRSGLKTA